MIGGYRMFEASYGLTLSQLVSVKKLVPLKAWLKLNLDLIGRFTSSVWTTILKACKLLRCHWPFKTSSDYYKVFHAFLRVRNGTKAGPGGTTERVDKFCLDPLMVLWILLFAFTLSPFSGSLGSVSLFSRVFEHQTFSSSLPTPKSTYY